MILRTRGSEHKLKCGIPAEHTKTLIFTVNVVKHRHRLSRVVLESPIYGNTQDLSGHGPGQPALSHSV